MSLKSIPKFRLPTGRFSRGALLIAGGAIVGQLVGFLVSPILTRLYTPEQFGVLGVYISILGSAAVVASLRFEVAILLPKEDQDAAQVFALALLSTLFTAILAGLLLWAFADPLVGWVKIPSLKQYLWTIPIAIFLVGVAQSFNYWAMRKQAFGKIANTKLSQGIGAALSQVALGYLGLGSLGLLVGDIVGRVAGTTSLIAQAWRSDRHLIAYINSSGIRQMVSLYRRFPLLSGPSSLINSLGIQLPTLLIAGLYGAHTAGFFALGQRIVGGGLALVSQPIGQTYISKLSSLDPNDPKARQKLIGFIVPKMFLLAIIPLGILAAFAPQIFTFLFGQKWHMAGSFVQAQAPQFLLAFITVPVSQTLNVLQRQDIQLIWDIGRLLLVLGSFGISKVLALSPFNSILLFSLVMTVCYLALLIIVYRLAQPLEKKP